MSDSPKANVVLYEVARNSELRINVLRENDDELELSHVQGLGSTHPTETLSPRSEDNWTILRPKLCLTSVPVHRSVSE